MEDLQAFFMEFKDKTVYFSFPCPTCSKEHTYHCGNVMGAPVGVDFIQCDVTTPTYRYVEKTHWVCPSCGNGV